MIPFICPSCGHLDIDSPECASCAQAPGEHTKVNTAVV
jgi:hypothetical protein